MRSMQIMNSYAVNTYPIVKTDYLFKGGNNYEETKFIKNWKVDEG